MDLHEPFEASTYPLVYAIDARLVENTFEVSLGRRTHFGRLAVLRKSMKHTDNISLS